MQLLLFYSQENACVCVCVCVMVPKTKFERANQVKLDCKFAELSERCCSSRKAKGLSSDT